MKNVFFYLGMGSLFAHELDAMPNHEWRVLPLVRILPDDTGMIVFVLAHVPIFGVLIAVVASQNERTRMISKLGISIFLLVHGALHLIFMDDPSYEFSSALSNLLIFGGAVFGAVFLVLEAKCRYENAS